MAGHDARYGNVFVQFFPTQGVTVELQLNLLQLFIACTTENFEAIGRESENATIDRFKVDHSPFYPYASGSRFHG